MASLFPEMPKLSFDIDSRLRLNFLYLPNAFNIVSPISAGD